MPAEARAAMASSPPSSDDATHHDTPSTNVTAISPEARASSIKKDKAKAKGALTLAPLVHKPLESTDDDVFSAPFSAGHQSQLSPNADVFTPGVPTTAIAATPRAAASAVMLYDPTAPIGRPLGAGALVRDSVPDNSRGIVNTQPRVTNTAGVIGQPATTANDLVEFTHSMSNLHFAQFRDVTVSEGSFSYEEGSTRALEVNDCISTYAIGSIKRVLETAGLSTEGIDTTRLASEGRIVVTFNDVRDARQAYIAITANPPPHAWTRPMNAQQLAAHRGELVDQPASLHEGQVLLHVYYDEQRRPPLPADRSIGTLRVFLQQFGEVKALHSFPARQTHVRAFRSEFYDIRGAKSIIDFTEGRPIQAEELLIEASAYTPDLSSAPLNPSVGLSIRAYEHVSATGRSTVPVGTPGYTRLVSSLQGGDPFNRRRSGHSQYTRINVDRIRMGNDVRTTVMLRNIPNRVTQAQLKEIIDQTSYGAYDFMYLRIDFANNCNVGYAFINFVEPLAIIAFAQAHQGRRWTACQSNKVAEISYATIQGRENLVQKFRNSSVMLENPSFRPKLYFTGDHPQAGYEEPFPLPDNLQKMRRSVENAETVGLYPNGNYTPPSSMPTPTTGSRTTLPLQVIETPSRSGVAALCSPGIQALINPSSSTRPTPLEISTRMDLHPLLSIRSNRCTPPDTPYTPPTAPMPAEATPTTLKLVDTQSPYDPFRGRADRERLFAPRQGQQYREEQHRRCSQYDRGTPGAELELQGLGSGQRFSTPARGSSSGELAAPGAPYRNSRFPWA